MGEGAGATEWFLIQDTRFSGPGKAGPRVDRPPMGTLWLTGPINFKEGNCALASEIGDAPRPSAAGSRDQRISRFFMSRDR